MSFSVDVERQLGTRTLIATLSTGPGLTALVGPSGAGKTSVLNMIAGLLRPARGSISVAGERLFDSERGLDLAPERRRAGYVFQDGRLFPHLRVDANLSYGQRIGGQGWISFEETVTFLGVGDLLRRWPSTLSGGEARRVAVGRALLAGARFLLMDEPLASLDAANRESVLVVVERIRDELRLPILYVSHDRQEVDRLATTVVTLDA